MSIDQHRRICRGKLIRFNQATGKRLHGKFDTSSLVTQLKLKEDFQYKQIFFGEHLIRFCSQKPVAITEAEKTAVLCSICFPEFVWLATGSKQSLKTERLKRLGQRKIVLYPDADGFALWQEIAFEARLNGLTVKVSDLIERLGTDAEKGNGFDLADYLINQQRQISKTNDFVDSYNVKLEKVLNDEKLYWDFETILEEQKAVMTIDGNLSEAEAETRTTGFENLRQVVLSL